MFIIQYNMMHESSLQAVKSAVIKHNIPHKFVGVIPFSHEITSDEPLVGTEFLLYGSTLMTNITATWRGNYHDPETFDAEVWNANRTDMLNNDSTDVIVSIKDAVILLEAFDDDMLFFTRPCLDLKAYSGQVMSAKELRDWLIDAMACESSGSYQLAPETMIVLAEPKNIQAEWRWFVVDSKVISGSMYRFNGVLDKRQELDVAVIVEAQRFADVWLPHRNCVMDLALVDGEMKVIEFNTIGSSGFYDHNVDEIICTLWYDFVNHA